MDRVNAFFMCHRHDARHVEICLNWSLPFPYQVSLIGFEAMET